MILRVFASLTALLLVPVLVGALPSQIAKQLTWDDPNLAGTVTGFYLYYAQESATPRIYSDAQRIDLQSPAGRRVVVLDVAPSARGSLCFRVTAYNAQRQESGFSNENCGFFGLIEPTNLRQE